MRDGTESVEDVHDHIERASGLLANETRLAILKALLESPERTATFSELKAKVGVRDSGQFSYHLKRLSEYFVRRSDDGYSLRFGGLALYRAMLAGVSTGEGITGSFPAGSDCVRCGRGLEASYDSDLFTLRCPGCDTVFHSVPFPPGATDDRTGAEIVAAFDRRTRAFIALAGDGVCPWCSGKMSLAPAAAFCEADEADHLAGSEEGRLRGHDVSYVCERCEAHLLTTIGENLLTYPVVVAFHYDHGIDVTAVPTWELPFCVDDEHVTVGPDDPSRAVVTIALDDEELRVTVDDRLDVVRHEVVETSAR